MNSNVSCKRTALTPALAKRPLSSSSVIKTVHKKENININTNGVHPLAISRSSKFKGNLLGPNNKPPKESSDEENKKLARTLRACIEEVTRIELENSQLRAKVQQQQSIENQNTKLREENSATQALNLKLQAQILLQEKSSHEQLQELQSKFALLETYYQEVIAYVESTQRNE